MTPPAVHIVTLGCPKNEVDSDRMSARLTASGVRITPDLDSAEVAVVNTCAFIQAATEESIATVLELASEWKARRPGRMIVLAGCLASRYQGEVESELPEVDAFVPVADEARIAEVVAGLVGRGEAAEDGAGPPVPPGPGPAEHGSEAALRTTGEPFAYVSVADGCHRRCSYCTIPGIRGDYRSRPADDLVAEARLLVAGGSPELILVGQDVSSYGRGMPQGVPEADLARLVRRLDGEVEGLRWLRLMYVQPDGVTDALLEAMAACPSVCRYLDIPLQHASEKVLRAMGRQGGSERFLELLSRIRGVMPDIRLRTTFIAGFPGETDADVEELIAFVKKADLDYAGVFTYSPEEGTPAAELPDLPSEAERISRTQRVLDTAEPLGIARVERLVDSMLEVLVEGRDAEAPFGAPGVPAPVGRWRGQAPEVDGAVYVDREMEPGAIVAVRIMETLGFDLYGEVV